MIYFVSMKKNVLLILLSAFALTGCELDLGFIKIGEQQEEVVENQKSSENLEENSKNQEENPQKPDDENPPKDEEEPPKDEEKENLEENEYSVTIATSGTKFASVASNAGVQFDHTDFLANETKLQNYFASNLEYENLLESIECTKLNTALWNNIYYLCIGTGYYANNKFNEGTLKWNSQAKIYKVEISAQAYAKENSYSGNIIDKPAHIWIDEDDHSLEVEQESELSIHSFSKEYAEGVQSFSIKSIGARVLLESLTITWRA